MLLIIMIIMIVPYMHEIHQNTIKYSFIVLFITVPSRYAVSHIYVKIPTLVAYFSTKGNIFAVNQYISHLSRTVLKKSLSR